MPKLERFLEVRKQALAVGFIVHPVCLHINRPLTRSMLKDKPTLPAIVCGLCPHATHTPNNHAFGLFSLKPTNTIVLLHRQAYDDPRLNTAIVIPGTINQAALHVKRKLEGVEKEKWFANELEKNEWWSRSHLLPSLLI